MSGAMMGFPLQTDEFQQMPWQIEELQRTQGENRKRIVELEQMVLDLKSMIGNVPQQVTDAERVDRVLAFLNDRKVMYTKDVMTVLGIKHNVQAYRVMERVAEECDGVKTGKNSQKRRFIAKI